MEDVVHWTVDVDGVDNVVVEERELVLAQVRDVLERSGFEVVDTDDAVALLEQVVAKMRSEEAGTAGDD
jgi:hypothetical protein